MRLLGKWIAVPFMEELITGIPNFVHDDSCLYNKHLQVRGWDASRVIGVDDQLNKICKEKKLGMR